MRLQALQNPPEKGRVNDQLHLFPAKAPSVTSEDVALLMRVLAGRDWMSGSEVAETDEFQQRFLGSSNANFERRIRAIANRSQGFVLSYPGSPGYRLTVEAKIEEIQTATRKLRHQAGQMLQRALEIDRVYHGKQRPKTATENEPCKGPSAAQKEGKSVPRCCEQSLK